MIQTAKARASHRAWIGVVLVFLLVLVGAGSISAAPAFPVKYSANQRFLVDQLGVPFPIMGRTAWFLTSLSVADYQTFIDDTASRGYSAIEFHVVNHDPRGNNEPRNGNNDLPFLKRLNGTDWNGSLSYSNINNEAPDFATPNEAYWSFVDALLAYSESKGLLVFMFPAYVGYIGEQQGWMKEMVANGATLMNTYGAWIANRYKNQKNLVWMAGGDMGSFTSAQFNVENALLTGLTSVAGQQSVQFSAEWDSEMIATDQSQFRSLMTLNGVYSWSGDVNNHGRRAYARTPTMPAFLLEEPYDEEGPDGNSVNPSATQPVRRFQWWGWLSTIGGYISGNGYVWTFNAGWQSHMNTQGAQDMARLNAFIRSIAWYNLVPSGLGGMRTLITDGGTTVNTTDYVAAAASPDGKLLVAYIPPAHNGSITVDMVAMGGPARARWFDPTSGAYSDAGTGLANTGLRSFTPPGVNSASENDWVLVLQVGATRFDFNGDGKSDILWRDTSTGENYLFFMDGKTLLGISGYTATVPLVWTVAGTADFNGDGKADILWRNTSTGENYLFFMDGKTLLGISGYTATVPSVWTVAGTADFNGDGKADILWRNTSTGENYLFFMDGKTLLGISGYTATVPSVWTVAGTADFNGDGKADILWRNTSTGENYLFFMDGKTLLGISGYTATVPLVWEVAGTADFNGDGKADILWRNNSTGQNYISIMNGTTWLLLPGTSGYIDTVPSAWTVAGIADFNGDGKADILWRNTTGENYLFFMDGKTLLGTSGYMTSVATSWSASRGR